MAGVTYLVRMLPMAAVKGKIESRFVRSFIYYMPFAVLSAMTIPSIFYSTSSVISAAAGFTAAMLLSYFGKSMLTVSIAACGSVLAAELLESLL